MKPIPKAENDHRKLNGYGIFTMQNTDGKITMRTVAMKLARDLEDSEVLQANHGVVVFRPGKCSWENAATFAYGVYENFQRKEQTLAMATDLEDAYNRRLQQQVTNVPARAIWSRPNSIRWITGVLLERTVAICSIEAGALLFINSQWAYHKDHRSNQSSTMNTPKAWQI